MTTPNIEWLIGHLRSFSGTSLAPALMHQAADTLQSQEERIAKLERESETHSKAYGLAIVERDNLRAELGEVLSPPDCGNTPYDEGPFTVGPLPDNA